MFIQGTPDLETIQSFFFHVPTNAKLMQFTGLKDKNGKEIYEGDIIVADYDKEVRKHRQIIIQWQMSHYKNGWNVGNNGELFEVIGNIYENPELFRNTVKPIGVSKTKLNKSKDVTG
jgi:uncharacterized phage protein (TIGR01671 family)